jgi:type I restriction enzyme R subunit
LYWEELWLFLKHLVPLLKIEDEELDDNILEVIDMDSYRTSRFEENRHIMLAAEPGEIDPIPVSSGGGEKVKMYETLESIVSAFNQRFGNINWGEGVDAKEAEKTLTETIPNKIQDDLKGLMAILNSDKTNAKEESNTLVKEVMQSLMFTNTGIFKKFSDDEAFRNRYQEFIFDMIWAQGNSDRVGK